MSLTSYRAAPPRAERVWFPNARIFGLAKIDVFCLSVFVVWNDEGPLLAALGVGQGPFGCIEKIVLRFADLAATYSPAS